jgi:DNA-directed RNA polymerase subunit H (RpoH/RPB5)
MSGLHEIPECMRFILRYHRLKLLRKFVPTVLPAEETGTKIKKPKKSKYSLVYTQYLLGRIDDPTDTPIKLLLTFFSESNVNINEILNAVKCSTVHKYQNVEEGSEQKEEFLDIIILLHSTTPPALRALKELVNESNKEKKHYISLIFRYQIAWDKSKSHYIQHYELIPEHQTKKFLTEHMYNEIPKMLTSDQVVILYGFQTGDIVHALESDTYRLVVVETLEPQSAV